MPRGKPKAVATIPITPDWQAAFKANTVKTNFVLTLTRSMLEFLCATADDVVWDRRLFGDMYNPDNWLASEHALKRRGLIVRKSPEEYGDVDYEGGVTPAHCKLTPAGAAVVELLKVAGMFVESDQVAPKSKKKA